MSEIYIPEMMVNVRIGSLSDKSTCTALKKHRCKSKAIYMLFCDDGRARSSRLYRVCCKKHLAKAISEGWERNAKTLEEIKTLQLKQMKKQVKELSANIKEA